MPTKYPAASIAAFIWKSALAPATTLQCSVVVRSQLWKCIFLPAVLSIRPWCLGLQHGNTLPWLWSYVLLSIPTSYGSIHWHLPHLHYCKHQHQLLPAHWPYMQRRSGCLLPACLACISGAWYTRAVPARRSVRSKLPRRLFTKIPSRRLHLWSHCISLKDTLQSEVEWCPLAHAVPTAMPMLLGCHLSLYNEAAITCQGRI